MNPFRNFELKHGELKKAEEHKVMISLKSDYGWGSGWTSGERKRFENVVYSALREAGYDIVPPEDDLGCPHLQVKAGLPMRMRDNRLDLYMHPMEFTGYAKPEDAEKIINILNNECSDAVYETELVIDEEVYDLNDYNYKEILMENAGEIMERIERAKENGYVPYEVGFEFARSCRIPRYGDGSGLGFSDVDITTVSDIVKVAEVLKEYELKKINSRTSGDAEREEGLKKITGRELLNALKEEINDKSLGDAFNYLTLDINATDMAFSESTVAENIASSLGYNFSQRSDIADEEEYGDAVPMEKASLNGEELFELASYLYQKSFNERSHDELKEYVAYFNDNIEALIDTASCEEILQNEILDSLNVVTKACKEDEDLMRIMNEITDKVANSRTSEDVEKETDRER